ncbi:hypothetical protein [Burkholderia anthina]|uniref:hypothetical protein n=1 Tax=Burkholderia anthina TaxID=179879 RepID=UPI00158E692A|nr:hypothetical protein [Burkholderia anthina]
MNFCMVTSVLAQELPLLQRVESIAGRPASVVTLGQINSMHADIERQIMCRGDGHVTDEQLTALTLLRAYRRQVEDALGLRRARRAADQPDCADQSST